MPFADAVGVPITLVGAEVPLAEDADFVAPDVDVLEPALLEDVWLVVAVPGLEVIWLLSVDEGVEDEEVEDDEVEDDEVEDDEVEEEEVELDALVVKAVDEGLADSTVFEPSTVILSL